MSIAECSLPAPVILVYINNPDPGYLKELLYGIEEEGVLCRIRENTGDAAELSRMAAETAALGCGIGICADEAFMAVVNIPGAVFDIRGASAEQYRILGHNAARYVKKRTLIM